MRGPLRTPKNWPPAGNASPGKWAQSYKRSATSSIAANLTMPGNTSSSSMFAMAVSRHPRPSKSQAGSAGAAEYLGERPAENLPEICLEQPVYPFIFVQPGIGVAETMPVERVRRHGEIVLVQFDQTLIKPHGIFEQDVVVDHAVTNEQRILEACGELNRR